MSTDRIPHCPRCGGDRLHPRGSQARPHRYQCAQCSKYFTDDGFSPKVLVFDIETLPMVVNAWSAGKQYISPDNILEDYAILSWSAKSLFDASVTGDILTPAECQQRWQSIFRPDKAHNADERIVRKIWKLLDRADCVITQNGKKFDVKKLNTRFIYYGLPPPHPFHHIDTLEAANAAFDASSHRLGYMTKFLSLPRKMDTNFELWQRCQIGDPAALKTMYDYGLNDTLILEDYYARIRAWIPNHPNFSAYTNMYVEIEDGVVCPTCRHILDENCFDGIYKTPIGNEYDSFRCAHCGTIGRKSKKNPGRPYVRRAG